MKNNNNDNPPAILYKYRDWEDEFHKQIITERTIWLPSCKNLNDPDDCKTPICIRKNTKEKKQQIKELIHKRVSKDFNSLSRRERKKIEVDVYNEKNYDNYELQKHLQSETIDNRFGIFSLSTNPRIPEMWTDYANHNKGFFI
jgi:hypothetical protein